MRSPTTIGASFLLGLAALVISSVVFPQDLTIGVVKSRIAPGMSQAKVIEAIGSPNIITTDKNSNEVWVYDKLSTETHATRKKDEKGFAVGGGGFLGDVLLGGGFSNRDSESSTNVTTSKKTLTVIIKFAGDQTVREVTSHMSQF